MSIYQCRYCNDHFTNKGYIEHIGACKRRRKESMYLPHLIKYKIHAIDTVAGSRRSANNSVFYDTYEEAEAKCKEYLRKGDCGGFVIMKTYTIVKPATAPVRVYGVMADDDIQELSCDG